MPTRAARNTVMVNNTTALLTGDQPVASQLQFNVRTTTKGKAVSMVVPKKPD